MLTVSGIKKQYRGKTVLHDAGFTLAPGEALGIAGHNGSGKTTLLSIVAQVTKPDEGDILYDGVSVMGSRAFLRENVGYIPQNNGLLGDLSVRETLRFWQRAYGLSGPLFASGSIAEQMGLEELAAKRVKTLSGGMQRRLSVAIALLRRPRLLLMDEVLPALDRHYRSALRSEMDALRREGGSILYCSHEAEELRAMCERVLVMRGGKTAYYGSAAEFPADPTALDAMMNPIAHTMNGD